MVWWRAAKSYDENELLFDEVKIQILQFDVKRIIQNYEIKEVKAEVEAF